MQEIQFKRMARVNKDDCPCNSLNKTMGERGPDLGQHQRHLRKLQCQDWKIVKSWRII